MINARMNRKIKRLNITFIKLQVVIENVLLFSIHYNKFLLFLFITFIIDNLDMIMINIFINYILI